MGMYIIFNAAEVAAAAVVLPLVGALLVALRFMGRHLRRIGRDIDDWLTTPALLFLVGMGITIIYGVAKKAVGYQAVAETDEIFRERYSVAMAVFFNCEWLQILALGCIKLSFLFFYRRVFVVNPKRMSTFNILTLGSIVLVIMWTVSFFIAALFTCKAGHLSALWASGPGRQEPSPTRAEYCWNTKPFLYAICWSDVGTDVIILILPIPSILKLQMSLRRKLAVLGIFFLGAVTLFISTFRAATYIDFLNIRDSATNYDDNMLNTNGIYWIMLETGMAMIVVNLPPLYGVIRHDSVGAALKQVRSAVSFSSSSRSSRSEGSTGQDSFDEKAKWSQRASTREPSTTESTSRILVTREVSLISANRP